MKRAKWIKRIGIPLLIILITGIGLRLGGYRVFRYPPGKNSMSPTILSGDVCLCRISRHFPKKNLKTGSIILLRHSDYSYFLTKRVIGIPGDKVIIKSGETWINDNKLAEPYADYGETGETEPIGDISEATVPEGSYFVMGDNRRNSLDSRYARFGFVGREQIVGRPLFVLWSKTKAYRLRRIK